MIVDSRTVIDQGSSQTSSLSMMGLIFLNWGLLLGSAFQQMSMILCRWWLMLLGITGRACSLATCSSVCWEWRSRERQSLYTIPGHPIPRTHTHNLNTRRFASGVHEKSDSLCSLNCQKLEGYIPPRYMYILSSNQGSSLSNFDLMQSTTRRGLISSVRVSHVTLMPTCMGERPEKGILLVAISHRMTAKLYMSAALLSMSSGRCCRAGET